MEIENDLKTFKLNSSNSKSSSSQSKDSKSSKDNSINSVNIKSFEKNFMKNLLTIEELKIKSSKEKNYSQEESVFDLDKIINREKIINAFESKSSEKEKIKYFKELMYKISYKDRIYFLNKYKEIIREDPALKKYPKTNIYQREKLKNIFINILNQLIIYENNFLEFQNLLQNEYFVETQNSNIPFIYGSKEYIYSNLINDVYEAFIIKKDKPSFNKDIIKYDEKKYLSNIINKNLFIKGLQPIQVEEIEETDDKFNESEKEEKKLECESSPEEEEKEENKTDESNLKIIQKKFNMKRLLIEPIIKKYCSEEFQNKVKEFFKNYPQLKNDKKIKYAYEIIIELLLYYCINFNEEKKTKKMEKYSSFFYEYEKDKIKQIKFNNDIEEINNIKKDIFVKNEKLLNCDYNIKIQGLNFDINFYDYNTKILFQSLDNIDNIKDVNMKKRYIQENLDCMENWTMQKHIKLNRVYNNKEINELFEMEIDSMFQHELLRKIFGEIIPFKGYEYPLIRKEFRDQIFKSILFVPAPTKSILGLTFKKLGIILINKGRNEKIIGEENEKSKKFVLRLAEFSFYKTTILHETNFHYFLVIFLSNKSVKSSDTPKVVFKKYRIKEKIDFGFKGEALLFGSKVYILFINGIKEIITMKLWNESIKNNIKLKDIGEKFFKLNQESENPIKIRDLVYLNKFTQKIFNLINEETSTTLTIKEDLEIKHIFVKGKIIDINGNMNLEEAEDGEKFLLKITRGECLNNCMGQYSN